MFFRCVSITVSHVLTGAGTSPCLREYFSLGGCCVLGSYNIFYNIFGYCTVYFTLGGCFVLGMEQCIWWWCCHSCELGIGPMVLLGGSLQIGWLSLGLTTDRSPPRSWFKSLSALDCDNSNGISKFGSFSFDGPFRRVWSGPPCWYGLDNWWLGLQQTGSCFLSLMALFSGYSVSAI